ncbi:hypothetical protein BC834DRAFT_1043049 [Gloeopeniophorella convolvens]|nr:hypothetical protein BC834DRAFT_1043049 [Gloeopeniophorella convolvens]
MMMLIRPGLGALERDLDVAQAAPPPPEDADDRVAREMQQREEERLRVAREQEERDAELARTLDLELKLTPDSASGLPLRRAEAVGGGGLC